MSLTISLGLGTRVGVLPIADTEAVVQQLLEDLPASVAAMVVRGCPPTDGADVDCLAVGFKAKVTESL